MLRGARHRATCLTRSDVRRVRFWSGEALVVSQFTLYGDTQKGRRPSWTAAASADVAEPLVSAVVGALVDLGVKVATGQFQADMAVSLCNDGPVTVTIEV